MEKRKTNPHLSRKRNFQFDGVINMKIREVNENKKQFIALLLLADEQENMIDHYLEKGTMYVLEDGNVKAECVVTDEDNGILEIKNIAVDPQNQGQGYGKALIDFLSSKYADEYSILQVGTGDSPLTVPFYEKCGFVRSHNIPNFFTDNYDHPIYECGVQLIDMVYLQRCL
nr:GNAT family N-acetyltransferase [Mediterraneibacter gnavus]